MERKERTTATSVKIPEGILSKIDRDVEQTKDFASRTDWIMSAIRYYLDYRKSITDTCDPDFIDTPEPSVQVSINDISRRI